MTRDGDLGRSTMQADLRAKWPIVALHSVPVAITAEQIRRERRRRKLTQQELADAAGVGLRTIRRVERGDESRYFEAIAAALGLQTDGTPDGKLLRDASLHELLDRVQELYDDVVQRASIGPTYKPGAPEPDDGLTAGPRGRTEQISRTLRGTSS